MLSVDTNILFIGTVNSHPKHGRAAAFLNSIQNEEVVISEFILLELYVLLRNPVVMPSPLSAVAAVTTCQAFREHPTWQIAGFPSRSVEFHTLLWAQLGEESFARRRAYDCRTALALLSAGATEFATENTKDFEGFGFSRVWNPIAR